MEHTRAVRLTAPPLAHERTGADAQNVLELGCGWGSLCMHIAGKYKNSTVTAVSNSRWVREAQNLRHGV